MSDGIAGYKIRDTFYCQDCTPDSEAKPIWEDHELDKPQWCEVCGQLITATCSSDGLDFVLGRLEDYLVSRLGRKKDLHMLAHQYQGQARNDAEKKIYDMAFWATSDEKKEQRLINILDRET